MTADEFLKIHKVERRTSKMEPWMDEILKLRRNGVSYGGILKFLRLNGVEVTMATFSVYMRKHAPPELVPPAKNQPTKSAPKTEKAETSGESSPPATVAPPKGAQPASPTYFDKKSVVKFDPGEIIEDE